MDIKLAAQLKDIHLPEEPGIWPLAPGWWCVLLLTLLIAAVLIYLVRKYRQGAAKREALIQLQQVETQYQKDEDSGRYYSDISKLLRRAAIHAYSREACAGLSGDTWLQFLQSHSTNGGFVDGIGRELVEAQFKPQCIEPADTKAIYQLTEQWLRRNL